MTTCAFCSIINKRQGATVIAEWEDCMAFFPLEPATLGHTLVVPKIHIESFWDLRPSISHNLFDAAVDVARAQREALPLDGMNVINSTGSVATQTVPHLHVHVLPRYKSDSIVDFWPISGVSDDERLANAARALRGLLS